MTTTATNPQEIFESLVGDKATIFKYSDFGFPLSIPCQIMKVYREDYAQYKNMLCVVYKPKGKRTCYVFRVYDYSTYMVYAGHVTLNTDMFVSHSVGEMVTTSQSLECFSDSYIERAIASTDKKPLVIVRG